MQTVKVGLVGYGMFGSDVVAGTLWDLQRNGISPYLDRIGLDDRAREYVDVEFDLVGIGTRSEASAQRGLADNERETGKRPGAYFGDTPWDSIMADHPDLDILVVATPDHLHTAPIMSALRNGTHIVAEKPLCLCTSEADEIIALAESSNLIVGVDMHKRYDPDHKKIFGELLAEMGQPIYARGVLEEPLEVSTDIFKWVEDSDPFTYVGIHWVDLFMHYLDLEPLAAYAVGQKMRLRSEFGKDAFDAVQATITHKCGLTIIYENNWLTPADFEGPVNQESHLVGTLGKVESDSQYRGLRYWIETKGSRTTNTHFFRQVARPDGSLASLGYGKDSLIDCIERVLRVKNGTPAVDLDGTYPDAKSQRGPVAVVDAVRAVIARNQSHFDAGRAPVATASFGSDGILLHDPHAPQAESVYARPL
ncbi:MAG TPA: Gfo/Idh/MocA family oxidoreductase [Armatimonadota bacterium]|nr:Gfo/Idh/MocA family oxidoreductase [Armatimonadota bacterium]